MASVYAEAWAAPSRALPTLADRGFVGHAEADLAGWTREARSELEPRFRRLPNPTLVIYVFPHLVGDMPVPGYVTTVPLYERDHYALPGEVP